MKPGVYHPGYSPLLIMKKIVSLIIVLLVAVAAPVAANRIELLTPRGTVSTTSNHLYLIGRASADSVQLLIDGGAGQVVPVVQGMFHIHQQFGYGLHELILLPGTNGMYDASAQRKVQVMIGPSISTRFTLLFPKHRFHRDHDYKDCQSCHPQPDSCSDCHASISGKLQRHSDMAERGCAGCHKPDRPGQSNAILAGHQLCHRCHLDKTRDKPKEYMHGPVAGGSCLVCHAAHGSEYDHNLVDAEAILCFSCHPFKREFKDLPVQHKPFAEGRCGVCHEPHGSDNHDILVMPSEVVCQQCHDPQSQKMLSHQHPYNQKPNKARERHKDVPELPLSDKGLLECLSCHEPHASSVPKLLKVKEEPSCWGCHPDRS